MGKGWLSNNPDTFTYAVGLELKFKKTPKKNERTSNVKIYSSGTAGHWNFKPSFAHKLKLINRVIWS